MAPPIPKGFIMVNGARIAVSEIVNYNDDTSNGAHCVRVHLRGGGTLIELGISSSTIDARINDARFERED